jgi:cholesterol transport system auxiliary component
MRATGWLIALLSVSPVALGGCAFFGKSEPLSPRFYDAENDPSDRAAKQAQGVRANDGPGLRLGRVIGGAHLRERIAFRNSARELGFYEERRWTERPEVYVRRAISRALFDERAVTHIISGGGPMLEVELTDFDELRAPKHAVRVAMRVALLNLRTVSMERTFTVELPVKDGDRFDAVAEAMAQALEQCVQRAADAVTSELATLPTPPPVEPAETAAPALQ